MSTAATARTAQSGPRPMNGLSRRIHISWSRWIFGRKILTSSLREKFPKFPPRNSPGEKPGGWDPKARLGEMEVDGVSAEVLYPTLVFVCLLWKMPRCRRLAFEIANDWLIDYCKVAPGRLVGNPDDLPL